MEAPMEPMCPYRFAVSLCISQEREISMLNLRDTSFISPNQVLCLFYVTS